MMHKEREAVPEIRLSIITPVFNNLLFTRQYLEAVVPELGGDAELIIVDDASTDDTQKHLASWKDSLKESLKGRIHILQNVENIGFLKSCNRGARIARGKYILFLNNDTVPHGGFADHLMRLAETDEKVGAVGAKLIYPDGRLQEAGGIVFRDGSAKNYGRYKTADMPQYNFIREVDYCSGACLLVRKALFDKVGGFDERFSPAYYEDTDLCFSIRQMGYKVLYQPLCVVKHHEGVSCGKDVYTSIKRYQEVNRVKFVEKWKCVLSQQFPPEERFYEMASDRRRGKNILVIYHQLPAHDRNSGALRLFNILKILTGQGHRLTFFAHRPQDDQNRYKVDLEQIGVMVAPLFKKGEGISMRTLKRRFFLKKFLALNPCDLVWFVHYDMGQHYLKLCRKYGKQTKLITDSVDVHFLREGRMAELLDDEKMMLRSLRTKRQELSIYGQSDLTIAITNEEKEMLMKELPQVRIEVIPNIHDIASKISGFHSRDHLLFVGGYGHPPNPDAVKYFNRDIFPLIKKEILRLNLFVVGQYIDALIKESGSNETIFTGPVDDLQSYMQSCRVFVAPLRFGAGLKGKIGEAMASGIPVVTTSIGAEGMNVVDGENILIGDTPGDFAERVIMVYSDEALWKKISSNAIRFVEENYSSRVIGRKIDDMIQNL
ncbi:MAG: glycosyltransferase [Acidobacteriota bacterium]